ncbi:hypothetical protein L7F22_017557 [Adiantum nelumboides]|nr:hypothetical protein [Adiantum nelumboides]
MHPMCHASSSTAAARRVRGAQGKEAATEQLQQQEHQQVRQEDHRVRDRKWCHASSLARARAPRSLSTPARGATPVLQGIKNVGWEYADIVPDYQVGVSSCALFLSLRYHRLHPEYVHTRIQKLANMFTLRLLLVLCDVDQHQAALKELTKVALVNNLTLIVAWSSTEAGRYLETYKALEHRPPDLIRQRVANDYLSHLSSALTSVRGVNKTDVVTLASNFGSLKRIARADAEELAMCNGFGPTKVRRLTDAFHQPFRIGETRSWKERRGTLARSKGFFGNPDEVASTTTTRNRDRAGVATEVGAGGGGEETAAVAGAPAESAETRGDEEDARDDFDVLENMTEEEQLQLALEMSRSNGLDEDDLGDD